MSNSNEAEYNANSKACDVNIVHHENGSKLNSNGNPQLGDIAATDKHKGIWYFVYFAVVDHLTISATGFKKLHEPKYVFAAIIVVVLKLLSIT